MKGRDHFTAKEAKEIRTLLRALRKAEPGASQKLIRDQLRAVGFYISDWPRDAAGFTVSGFDDLAGRGGITLVDDPAVGATAARQAPQGTKRRKGRPPSEAARSAATRARVSRPELDQVVAQALEALSGGGYRLSRAADRVPRSPGLYAIYGSAGTWKELGLGRPPDARPLYLGKAEDSLVARDLATHFADGRTGSSTVRRSFAALLHDALGVRGIPRNQAKPGYYANYGLGPADDAKLTAWMRRRLKLAMWPKPPGAELLAVERALLAHWRPPLNLRDVSTDWSAQLSAARARMAAEARAWARRRGFDA
jgi:hypothetical protein